MFIINVWTASWSFRNAIRSALNGYDLIMVIKMIKEMPKELKYKRKH